MQVKQELRVRLNDGTRMGAANEGELELSILSPEESNGSLLRVLYVHDDGSSNMGESCTEGEEMGDVSP